MRDRHSRSVMMRNKGLPCAVGHFILTGDSASSIMVVVATATTRTSFFATQPFRSGGALWRCYSK